MASSDSADDGWTYIVTKMGPHILIGKFPNLPQGKQYNIEKFSGLILEPEHKNFEAYFISGGIKGKYAVTYKHVVKYKGKHSPGIKISEIDWQ